MGQCDTKWVVNEQGEKVWAGNENCVEITWEDCSLEMVATPVEVPIYKCEDAAPISYTVPSFAEVEVTGYKSQCTASAYPVCFNCGDGANGANGCAFKIPFQTYDHRLKCIG